MTSKTFVTGTVIDSPWLNDVNAAVYNASIINVKSAPYSAVGNGVTNDTAAFAAAIAALVARGGGTLFVPSGNYLLTGGAASPDGFKNGIALPDTGAVFSMANGINIVGEGVSTVLLAGSNNMIVVRGSRLFSGVKNLLIKGNGFTNVWASGLVPADMTQTTSLVSHSYQTWDIQAESCTEGMVIMPGPRVTGSDSGCFYHDLKITANLCTRILWTKQDVTGFGNRVTRSRIYVNGIRANTGVQIDYGTELDITAWLEMVNTGVTPNASPVAVLISANNIANIKVRGYAEACTRYMVALDPINVDRTAWGESGVADSSTNFTPQFNLNKAIIGKGASIPSSLSWGNSSYVRMTVDPDSTDSKTLSLVMNGSQKERWDATGTKTFYGTLGNITFAANGAGIDFSRNAANSITCAGAAGSLVYAAKTHIWQTNGAVNVALMDNTLLAPTTDNAMTCGANGNRWSAVWAANGTIQTSDPRTKTDIQETPLGLEFINSLKPVAYRFKIGGNVTDENGKTTPVPGKRLHYGFLTTDVKAAMDKVKVEDFGGYIKTDMNDSESEEALRYEEFIAPMVRAIQELQEQINSLRGELQ